MENNASIRFLALFLFCTFFSVNAASSSSDATATSDDTDLTDISLDEIDTTDSTDVTADSETEAVSTNDTTITTAGKTQSIGSSVRRSRTRTPIAKKNVKRASRKSVSKVSTGKARKQAVSSGDKYVPKSEAGSKKIRRPKRTKSDIAKMTEFDSDGNLTSFKAKSEELVKFLNSKRMLNNEEKKNSYAALAKFRFILGQEGFATDGHYDASLKIFTTATSNPKLFSSYQMKRIKEWKKSIEKNKVNPDLRKAESAPTSTTRKQPTSKKGARTVSKPTKKSAQRKATTSKIK